MEKREITIIHTNKGYVAMEEGQIFDLWKNKSFHKIIYELCERYPNYNIQLVGMTQFDFANVKANSNQYLNEHTNLEIIS